MAFVSMTALGMASRAWRSRAWHNHFAINFWAWLGVVVFCVFGHGVCKHDGLGHGLKGMAAFGMAQSFCQYFLGLAGCGSSLCAWAWRFFSMAA